MEENLDFFIYLFFYSSRISRGIINEESDANIQGHESPAASRPFQCLEMEFNKFKAYCRSDIRLAARCNLLSTLITV